MQDPTAATPSKKDKKEKRKEKKGSKSEAVNGDADGHEPTEKVSHNVLLYDGES